MSLNTLKVGTYHNLLKFLFVDNAHFRYFAIENIKQYVYFYREMYHEPGKPFKDWIFVSFRFP